MAQGGSAALLKSRLQECTYWRIKLYLIQTKTPLKKRGFPIFTGKILFIYPVTHPTTLTVPLTHAVFSPKGFKKG
jgi:hypothetical protein